MTWNRIHFSQSGSRIRICIKIKWIPSTVRRKIYFLDKYTPAAHFVADLNYFHSLKEGSSIRLPVEGSHGFQVERSERFQVEGSEGFQNKQDLNR